jgi:Peptidase M50B-like
VTAPAPPSSLRAWAFALLASLLLWNLPFGGVVLYPFKLLATWLHELSHALVMEVSGVGFDRMVIYQDTSGLAYAWGASGRFSQPWISAAGYMGTPLVGGLLLVATRTQRHARWLLLLVGGGLAVSALTIIANDFGRRSIAAIALGFLALGLAAPARLRMWAMQFVAAQACVNALLDIRVLFRPVQIVGGKTAAMSDAQAMAAATLGTTDRWAVWTWAVLWLLWTLAVCFVAVRLAARPRRGGEPGPDRRGAATMP